MKSHSSTSRARRSARTGFTLVEVLVGTTLFTMVAMAVALTLQHSFRVIALARYEERAANILRVVADQFQTSVIDEAAPPDPSDPRKDFFRGTAPTGLGLGWNKRLQTFVYPSASATVAVADYIAGTDAGLEIPLSTTGEETDQAPKATLKRQVRFVDPASGNVMADGAVTAAAQKTWPLLRADFTLEYTILGQPRVLKLTALRNHNHSDK